MRLYKRSYHGGGVVMNGRIELTPKEVVEELNKYIIGQDEAKRVVAVA